MLWSRVLARNPVGVPRVAPAVPVLEIWADDQDRFSFEDSDRFEEDSLCSWSTEPESICNNWRGWKKPFVVSSSPYQNGKKTTSGTLSSADSSSSGRVASLCELTARCVASHIPFELVEHVYPPVPEQLQLRIAFWSFPDNEEDIRLYSCLANSSADEFTKGEALFKAKAVKDPLQIGFHLSATVVPPISFNQRGQYNVAVVFDRRRITSCNCTCNSSAYWCSHIVAVCLHRIHHPIQVCLRAPVSESLSRLQRDQLQKFAQYLISELPQQILPTAQRILDELLSSQPTPINSVCGAPDPTAGASVHEQTSWYLDEKTLHENIKKILVKFCVPAPIVFSDVNYLGTTAPPAAAEWTSLLRPLRGREPEGMWNLLSIVREMFKRNDRNALPLLQIITEECMSCEQIMVWWFNTKVALHIGVSSGGKHGNVSSNTHAAQHACASLCDEVVVLWRLAVLNPGLAPSERTLLCDMFKQWHTKTLDKVEKGRMSGGSTSAYQSDRISKNLANSIEVFSGFKPAIAACQLDWEEYPISGVTYQGGTAAWLAQPYTCFRNSDNKSDVNQVSSSQAVLFQQRGTLQNIHGCFRPPIRPPHLSQTYTPLLPIYPFSSTGESSRHQIEGEGGSGNRSSVSSEGFCENDQDQPNPEDDSIGASSSSSSCCLSGPVKEGGVANGGGESGGASSEESDPPKAKGPATAPATSRRLSKDDSLSSDSQQSGDEFYMYYYDPKSIRKEINKEEEEAKRPPSPVVASPTDPWDVLFARAEGLHAHGHTKEACILGVRLAEELLANPPNLMLDLPVMQCKGKRKRVRQINPLSHQLSVIASDTLAKCGFLCTVLAENSEHYHLAFKVGLFGLEMPRPPATTKPLEVKLFNQESELVTLLKRIPLGQLELNMIRERAQKLKEGLLRTRGESLLPLTLASYILDALTMPEPRCQLWSPQVRQAKDELLGFEAATAALGLKANVSEADHPLLCEGTRRQRGDLAVVLLVHYKSDPEKIAQIMDKLLDREVHQLMKTPLSPSYYTSHPPVKSMSSWTDSHHDMEYSGLIDPLSHGIMTMAQPPPLPPTMKGRNGPSPEMEASTSKQLPCSQNSSSPHVHPPSSRTKESSRRFKGKRAYPSIPNQPSEAGAHFMFELAKTVLLKAGGSSSTSLFTQASASQPHHSPHRALHMCAFQLGLYALGLHNCVSPNWLSRTYSSHVSWITGQAMEIGAPAISFLQDTWEGHLTPPEAANMADRASRGCDRHMTRAAAELALSCLPHAHALNPNEISRAISQCKEQSERMLEQSCLTVENAAKGGGVYPEVLFQVARYWYDLYIRHSPQGEGLVEDAGLGEVVPNEVEPGPLVASPVAGPGPYGGPPPAPAIAAVPYSLFAVAAPPHFHPHHQLAITAPQMYHIPTPQFQYFPSPPPPPHVYPATIPVGPGGATLAGAPPSQPPPPPPQQVLAVAPPPQRPPVHHHNQVARGQYNSTQIRYLLAAYRVGMLAMETIARRVHDDRPNAKYARNPPYGEDVKWLLRVAQKLGTQYLHQFCVCVVNSIVSPFVLHDVAIEAAHYLARGNPALLSQHLRSSLTPLVQKCQQMYIQCLHQKLYHLSSSDYDDFLSVVMSAKKAFQITPEGSQQFKEWLQSIRRSKSCKKELWAKINVVLPQTNGK